MPYNLSLSDVLEKNRIASDVPWLVCLDIDVRDPATGSVVEVLHLVHNTEDVVHLGVTYNAFAFSIDLKAESGAQSQVSITMDDVSRAVHERMQVYGGGIGFSIRIMVINADSLDSEAEVVESFEVISATTSDYSISWTLGTENLLHKKFPDRRYLRDRCAWRFKSVECAYAGATSTCDFSLQGVDGCGAKSNSVNFGGFPGIRANGYR